MQSVNYINGQHIKKYSFQDVYDTYVSKFYYNRHVELFNPEFNLFFKQQLDELEHHALITESTSSMDGYT